MQPRTSAQEKMEIAKGKRKLTVEGIGQDSEEEEDDVNPAHLQGKNGETSKEGGALASIAMKDMQELGMTNAEGVLSFR